MPDPTAIPQDKLPQNIDHTAIQIVDYETGDNIARFVGEQPPIPNEGDLIQAGWWDTEDGETTEDQDGPFRVMDRAYYYISRRDHDKNKEGLITVVTISAVPV